jgi:hypothetical protein
MNVLSDVLQIAITPRHRLRSSIAQAVGYIADHFSATVNMPLLGVRTEPMKDEGLFDPLKDTLGVRVSDKAGMPGMTVVHEIGHALDYFHYGFAHVQYKSYAVAVLNASDQNWIDFLQIVYQTPSVQQLTKLSRTPILEDDENLKDRVAYAKYLRSPHELFARVFAQYIALTSGLALLNDELKRHLIETDTPTQWQAEEFGTIIAPLEVILEELR